MKYLDRALAGILVLLGTVHIFIAAPMSFEGLTGAAMWFIAAGLALWYAGFINLIKARAEPPGRLLASLCVVTNLTLLVFVLLFAGLRGGNWYDPQALLLIATVASLTATSALTLKKTLTGP